MKKILFILAVVTLAYSCNKPDSGLSHATIDADVKAAFNYQPGTYWIYRDSISGRVDSFFIRSNKATSNSVAGNFILDGIEMLMSEYSTSTSDTALWSLGLSSNSVALTWVHQLFFKDLYNIDYEPLCNFPFTIGGMYSVGNGSPDVGYLNSINPSYTLNGITYSNVAIINHSFTSPTSLGYNDVYYVSSQAGIIKISLDHPDDPFRKVWELVRYKIVK